MLHCNILLLWRFTDLDSVVLSIDVKDVGTWNFIYFLLFYTSHFKADMHQSVYVLYDIYFLHLLLHPVINCDFNVNELHIFS